MAELITTSLYSDPRLVYYARFEGNSNDTKGTNNGSDTAITYGTANGLYGQGAGFNGTSSKVVVGNGTALQTSGDFSVSVWVKDAANNYPIICGKYDDTSVQFNDWFLGLEGTTLFPYFQGHNASPTGGVYTKTSSIALPASSWTLVNAVCISGSIVNMYVNGTLANGSASGTNNRDGETVNNFQIGQIINGGAGNYWSGAIDDLAIFTGVLNSGDINTIYSSGRGWMGLLKYW